MTKPRFEVTNGQLVSHMNMADCGVRIDGFQLMQKRAGRQLPHKLDKTKLLRIVRTPKKNGQWGKGKVYWALEGEKQDFEKIEELCKYYGIRLFENGKEVGV